MAPDPAPLRVRLVGTLLLCVVLAEAATEGFHRLFPTLSPAVETFLHSLLLVAVVFGVVHALVIRKLQQEVARREGIQARLAAGEQQARRSEARYRLLFEEAPVLCAVTRATEQGPVVEDCNRAFAVTLGFGREEILGRPLAAFYTEASRVALDAGGYQRALEGAFSEEERDLLAKDGRTVPTLLRARPLGEAEEGPAGTLAVYADLTAHKRAESERDRLAAAVEQAGEIVVLTDPEGRIVYVNPAFTRATGYRRQEALGRSVEGLLRTDAQPREHHERMWATIRRGAMWKGSFVNRRKDGSLFEVEATISPLADAAGAPTGYVAIQRDVTRERALEAQLRQSQKMETLGRLAGAVAHDFNNLLTVILGQTELLELEGLLVPRASGRLAGIRSAGERAAALTRQLLAFSRQQVTQPRVAVLNDLVRESEKLVRKLVGEAVRVEVVLDPEAGSVRVDPTQLGQVLLNLAANARDAMPQGGRLTLRTSQDPGNGAGPLAVLSVEDTGAGMDAATRERAFEPFFTTKGPGEGTGLGLATVYGIVTQAGGRVDVDSAPGRGSRFRVLLPRVDAPEAQPADSGAEPAAGALPSGGAETVLVVDDEPGVLEAVRGQLVSLGYRVLTAHGPGEALLLAEQAPEPIHLLLADVRMPLLDGTELARRVRGLRPEIRVLHMSGYAPELAAAGGGAAPCLVKPFSRGELARKVREALAPPCRCLPAG
ncbi:MAG: PAS domain-containing hybrid sensor histidine kinase/response regulator [Deferrisomatales bacterium]